VGALVANTATDEGYITLDDMIQNVITPLKSNFGSQFGGVIGWEFALDQSAAWANGIGKALGASPPGGCPGQSYIVVKGDALVAVAQRFLGDGNLWVEFTKPDGTHFTEAEAEYLQIGEVVCIPSQSTIDFSTWSLQEAQALRQPPFPPANWQPAILTLTSIKRLMVGRLSWIRKSVSRPRVRNTVELNCAK
jgi:hypothetical protein